MILIVLQAVAAVMVAAAINVVAGAFARQDRPLRGALALALSCATLSVPFLLRDVPAVVRTIVANHVALQVLRVVEVVRDPRAFSLSERAVRIALPIEPRLMRRVPRSLPLLGLAGYVSLAAVGIAGFQLAAKLAPPLPPYASVAGWPRWLAAAAAGYVGFEGVMGAAVLLLRPFGISHAHIQNTPILSRSLGEFWGRRWNSVIHLWLRKNVFEPCARRRAARLGVVGSFAASALLHFYIVLPACGVAPAAWTGAFFLCHGVGVVIEDRFGLRRLGPIGGRVFAVAVFVATIPLMLEPWLRAFGL